MALFIDKKHNVVSALHEACHAIYPSTSLDAIREMCVGYLEHKNSAVREQVGLFLAKCFDMSTQATLNKSIKLYLPQLIKNLSNADQSVRDSSSKALGAVYKCLGDKNFKSVTEDRVEEVRLKKIKTYASLLKESREPIGIQLTAPHVAAPTQTAATISSQKTTEVAKSSAQPRVYIYVIFFLILIK